ncbi:hypothetical protein OsI_10472 [Oryza sativa Indica Group]|uniref:Uncharacterized protein n=1 Tax=Oryza sativa subsp. indica TaxID=39946 RepID=B8AQH1_ORYSI|nr:hypothetical protein OsI_10472 [Oryza sativa Indica Group]
MSSHTSKTQLRWGKEDKVASGGRDDGAEEEATMREEDGTASDECACPRVRRQAATAGKGRGGRGSGMGEEDRETSSSDRATAGTTSPSPPLSR